MSIEHGPIVVRRAARAGRRKARATVFGGIGELILIIWVVLIVWGVHKIIDAIRRARG